jgi:hypothetical protein
MNDLPGKAWLNIDEAGHQQNGARMWTWCFRAGLYTLFEIDPTRSADVLIEVLGAEFNRILSTVCPRRGGPANSAAPAVRGGSPDSGRGAD